MLVLSRRVGEAIVIEGGIRVTVVATKGGQVRLGIAAPPSVRVDREEVHGRRVEFLRAADVPITVPAAPAPQPPRAGAARVGRRG
jgi:carbon storage regulator